MSKNKRPTLTRSLLSVALVSSLSSVTFNTFAEEAIADEEKIETIQVTGSRIKRTDLEAAKPVTVITKADIAATGLNDIASVLAESIFNSSGTSVAHSNNSAGNFSASNLRGIGSNRTLTLLNGRRLAASSSNSGSSVNLNLIPIEVVERIDVLRDGASSIYGSDAMGGVINIITKKDFDGLQLTANTSHPTRGGAETSGGAITFGKSDDKSNFVTVIEYQENKALKGGERPHIDAEHNDRRWSTLYSPWGSYRYENDDGDKVFNPGPTCPEFNIRDREGSIGNQCGYDVRDGKYYLPRVEKTSLFISYDYALTEDLTFYSSVLYSKDNTLTSATPMWASGYLDAGHENNPTTGTTDEREVKYYHYMEGALPREFTFETHLFDVNTGINWDTDNGTLSVNLAHSRDSFLQESNYYYFVDKFNEAVEDGLYNPLAYAGGPKATEDVLDTFRHTQHRVGSSTSKGVNVDWASTLPIELAGGEIGYATGFEYRKQTLSDKQDAQSNSGNVKGAYGGDTVGERSYKAAYLEVELPVLENLSISASTRYDDYSFPDQGQLSSSLSARYQATDNIVLRASFSEGFRVADLSEAAGEESIGYSKYTDPKYCNPVPLADRASSPLCEENEVQVKSASNPNLKPEESEQISFGLAYDISEDTGVTLDYWNIEISNQITSISGKTILDEEYLGNLGNYTGLYVNRDLTQNREDEITQIGSTTTNYLGLETAGIDASINSQFDLEDMGNIKVKLGISHVLKYEFQKTSSDPIYDYTGYYNRPETRANFKISYFLDNFESFAKIQYIDAFLGEDPEDEVQGTEFQDFPSMTTVNVGIGYDFEEYGILRLQSSNLFDKLPPVNTDTSRGYSYRIHSIIGRTLQLTYSKKF